MATILTLLVQYALGVPMLGNWLNYALVVALVLFASLGIGFVISLLSKTDSQAVQLAMLVLLASVFFSGFFMALYLFWPAVQVVSWMLVIGLGLFIVAWFQMNGMMARR